MRAPPPVEFNSALSGAWRTALCVLAGACVAVAAAWALPHLRDRDDTLLQAVSALGTAALAMAAAWFASRRAATRERRLRWDGENWLLAAGGPSHQRGDAALMLDLGPWMLVRFTPNQESGLVPGRGPSTSWLPLTLAGDPARWAALRGALWNWRAGPGNAR